MVQSLLRDGQRGARRWRAGLLVVLLWPAAVWGEMQTLGVRVREAHRQLKEWEGLYRQLEDAQERAGLVALMAERAAWLEQVGGLKEARTDQLLALARWEALGQVAPVYHGFAARPNGEPIAQLAVRRPRPGELPPALQPFEDRLFYVLLRNATLRPLRAGAGPWVECQTPRPPLDRAPAVGQAGLPKELRPFAELFAWNELLPGGREQQALALFPPGHGAFVAVGAQARPAEGDDPPSYSLRADLALAADFETWDAARKLAARLEAEIRAPRPQPPAGRAVVPPGKEPPSLGRVERTGGADFVQVRLNGGVIFDWGAVYRVRKDGAWTGRVRMPLRGPGEPVHPPSKPAYFATVLEGRLEDLAGGTLHPGD